MSTIKEISQLAGVSRGTVDRVLNNRGSVKPETAERIRQIAKALNYTPNIAGKTLAVKKKRLKFGFILFNSETNPFFCDVISGISDRIEAFKEYGVEIKIRYCSLNNPEQQVKQINELVSLGINGLAITPINHPLVRDCICQLACSGLPVITTNTDILDSGRICYVGSNYYQTGLTAAGLLGLICNSKAHVGVVLGSPLILCHSERVSGFSDHLNKCFPGMNIVDTVLNNDNEIESYVVVSKLLEEHPEINALYLASAGVEGACRAILEAGKSGLIKIVSHDITPAICSLIEAGVISATIDQQPFLQGKLPLDILLDIVGMGNTISKEFYYIKNEIKIRENIHDT